MDEVPLLDGFEGFGLLGVEADHVDICGVTDDFPCADGLVWG